MNTRKPSLSIEYEYTNEEQSDQLLSEVYAFLFRKICQQYDNEKKSCEFIYVDKIETPVSLLTSSTVIQYTYY